MLAAVMPTFSPSIWPLSWLAMSSQRSARAGEAAKAANAAIMAASRIGRQKCRRDVIGAAPSSRHKSLKPEQSARTFLLAKKSLERWDCREAFFGPHSGPNHASHPQEPLP